MNSIVANYKTKIASRYVSIDANNIGLNIVESEYYLCSIKYDGFFGVMTINKGEVIIYGKSGDVLTIPKLIDAGKKLNLNESTLAGEIVLFENGKPLTHRELASAMANPDEKDIRFAVFDIIAHNNQEVPQVPKARYDLLRTLMHKTDLSKIFYVEQIEFKSRQDVAGFYTRTIPDHEGIVVRSSNGIINKIKPKYTLDLVVLGYAEQTGEHAGLLREFLLGYVKADSVYQVVAKCGSGFSDKERTLFIRKLEKLQVESDYYEAAGNRTAFILIKPSLVCEISCLDFLSESGSSIIKKMALEYSESTGYSAIGNQPTVSCISPVFERWREEKLPDANDCGVQQILDFIDIDKSKDDQPLLLSQIIKREAYVKKAKEGLGLRKITLLKTNKENTDEYPPYVVVYTDFSSGRKNPLEQEIYICTDEKEGLIKMEEVKTVNIKKGWEKA